MLTDREFESESNYPTSIYDLLFNKNPNNIPDEAPIFISDEKTISFGELSILIRKVAYNLQHKFNIGKGDVVAIRAHPHIDYPLVMHGIVCAGGSAALIKHSPEDNEDTILDDLESVEPKLFITGYEVREISLAAAAKAGIPESQILVLGQTGIEGLDKVEDVLFVGENLAVPCTYTPEEFENLSIFMLYTSGSTGRRKAVINTCKCMLRSCDKITPANKRKTRILGNRPFYFGSTVHWELLTSIILGHQVYITKADTVDEICQAIERYKITDMISAPYILASMVKEEVTKKYDLSSLSSFTCVGAAAAPVTIQGASSMFNAEVINAYGSTEFHTPFIPTAELSAYGAVGTLKPEFIIRVVDENDNDVERGMPGELLVKGPTVSKGYYKNPDATAKAFTKDGFYRTGDVFICDKDGVFWFLSRSSNLMKYQSTHIYPYEIEKVVLKHPKVSDCGVIGIFSRELSTELPRAYVTLVNKEDYAKKEEIAKDILAYANSQLHVMKQIRAGVVVKETFERTPTGKILYPVLKEEASKEQTIL